MLSLKSRKLDEFLEKLSIQVSKLGVSELGAYMGRTRMVLHMSLSTLEIIKKVLQRGFSCSTYLICQAFGHLAFARVRVLEPLWRQH